MTANYVDPNPLVPGLASELVMFALPITVVIIGIVLAFGMRRRGDEGGLRKLPLGICVGLAALISTAIVLKDGLLRG